MKLLLIGSSVVDYIHEGENTTIKPGGIFYSLTGFNSIVKNDANISVLTNINKKDFHLFEEIYSKFDLSYSKSIEELPTIHLLLHPDRERGECYQNISEPLDIDLNINFNQFDAIFVNMITGFDISVKTLEKLREKFNKFIYIDIHSLARGLAENNMRNFRKIPHVERWLKCVDIIQVNETEFFTLSNKSNEEEIIKELFSFGLKGIIITMADKGIKAFFNNNGNIDKQEIKSLKIEQKNSVGCGDVFGSAFFYHYCKTNIFFDSANKANKTAGLFASCSTIEEFKSLINREQ